MYFRTYIILIFIITSYHVHAQIKFCAVGDVLLDRKVRFYLEKDGLDYPYININDFINSNDIAFFNLECPVTSKAIGYSLKKRFSFRAEPEYLIPLKKCGFNIASVANNHTIDMGRDGFLETLNNLKRNNIYSVGGGTNLDSAFKPVIIEKNGITIAFFAEEEFLLEGIIYDADKPGPAFANIDKLCKQVKFYNSSVNYIVVSFHWGKENCSFPTSRQIEFAHKVIDAGADLVIGHHPHILQGIEIYKNKLVMYSLGNFIFDNSKEKQNQTVILSCVFDKHNIHSFKFYPIEIVKCQPRFADSIATDRIFNDLNNNSKYFNIELKRDNNFFLNDLDTIIYPLNEFNINDKKINIYSNKIELSDSNGLIKLFVIDDTTHYIKSSTLISDNDTVYVCSLIGNISDSVAKQIEIFPVDLKNDVFLTPSIDSHNKFKPWKIMSADVDGDKKKELIVGTFKTTRYDKDLSNRLFVYVFDKGYIYPKWFGSKIGDPFIDYNFINSENDQSSKLILLKEFKSEYIIISYQWNGFGFTYNSDLYKTNDYQEAKYKLNHWNLECGHLP